MISGNFQFQQNTSCRHTDRDKNVAPLTLWSAVVIRQNPSSELLQHPIALARDKRSAIVQNEFILPERDLNDFSARTNVLIVGLLCTTRKGLSTSIVLWIKIPSVMKLVTAVKLESQSTRLSPLPGATRSYLGFRGEAILLASGSPRGQLVSPLLLQLGKSVSIQDQQNEMRRDKSSQHWCSMLFHFCSVILDCRMQDISGWDGRFGEVMTWCDEPHDIIEIYCVFSHRPNRWHMVKTDSSRTICSLGGLWHLASSSNVGFHHRFCSCGSTVKPTYIAGNSHKPEQDRIRWWKCLWARSWDF